MIPSQTRFILTLMALTAVALALSGCSTAQFASAKQNQIYPMRTAPGQIELFRSALPQNPFDEIGTISFCCSGHQDRSVQRLKDKASEMGGDALVGLDFAADGRSSASVIRYKAK